MNQPKADPVNPVKNPPAPTNPPKADPVRPAPPSPVKVETVKAVNPRREVSMNHSMNHSLKTPLKEEEGLDPRAPPEPGSLDPPGTPKAMDTLEGIRINITAAAINPQLPEWLLISNKTEFFEKTNLSISISLSVRKKENEKGGEKFQKNEIFSSSVTLPYVIGGGLVLLLVIVLIWNEHRRKMRKMFFRKCEERGRRNAGYNRQNDISM